MTSKLEIHYFPLGYSQYTSRNIYAKYHGGNLYFPNWKYIISQFDILNIPVVIFMLNTIAVIYDFQTGNTLFPT